MYFLKAVKKSIFILLTTYVIFISNTQQAKAFFTDNNQQNLLYGAFKKTYKTTIYFNVTANFFMYSLAPSVSTATIVSSTFSNGLAVEFNKNDTITKMSAGKYSYSLIFGIGYHFEKSNFRHELQVEWYSLYSNVKELSNLNKINIIKNENNNQSNETIKATNIDGAYYQNLGSFHSFYRFTYNIYYHFQNAFKALSFPWDIYMGAGFGFAIVDGGLYSSSSITTTTTENLQNGITIINNTLNTYDIDKFSDAKKHSIFKKTSFAIAYQTNIGLLANLSQSFAINIGINIGATTKPILNAKFHHLEDNTFTKSHLEMHIALQLGLLMKAIDFI